MTTRIRQLYRHLYGLVPIPIRYGKTFRDTYGLLLRSQWWTEDQLMYYQREQLRKLLVHAYDNVPYYTALFNNAGINPGDIRGVEDLKKLPCLTKDDIRKHAGSLIAVNNPKLTYACTSGSTGSPLEFYREKGRTSAIEEAFQWRMRHWVGYNFNDRCVVLRGNAIRDGWYEYNPIDNSLVLSTYDMSLNNLHSYVSKINDFAPKVIQAFPSGISILAEFLKREGIRLQHHLKAIFCGSERLYPSQRKLLEEVFDCRIFCWYGQSELVVLAGQCEKGNYYHLFPEYGVTEIDDDTGEIIGTGFNNYAMPLIRYKTGDIGKVVKRTYGCYCGRNYRLIADIEGRIQEFLVAKDGHLIPLGDMQIFHVFDNVKQFQFYQEIEGEVVFYVVRRSTFTDRDTHNISTSLYDRFGDSIKVCIKFTDRILPAGNGKHSLLIQKLVVG